MSAGDISAVRTESRGSEQLAERVLTSSVMLLDPIGGEPRVGLSLEAVLRMSDGWEERRRAAARVRLIFRGEDHRTELVDIDLVEGRNLARRTVMDEADEVGRWFRFATPPGSHENSFASALYDGQLGTWSYDYASRRFEASDSCKVAFGHEPDGAFGIAALREAIHPDDRSRVLSAFEDATYLAGIFGDVVFRIVTPAGVQRWLAVRGQLLQHGPNDQQGVVGFVTDITVHKDLEEHRRLLADELAHRFKNAMATVGAVVNQTLLNASSLSEARDVISGRIAALGVANELLRRDEGEGEGASLLHLVNRVLRPFPGSFERIGEPDVSLSPDASIGLSMVLHELATNAVKYGAFATPEGSVTLRWMDASREEGRRLRFVWSERLGPPVRQPTRVGFGSRMIERMTMRYLQGVAAWDYRPAGLVFTADLRL